MYIPGQPDDEAVLTTDTQTFRLRQVETSNTHLLLKNPPRPTDNQNNITSSISGYSVVAMSSTNLLEAIPIIGRTDKLEQLLWRHPYAGPEEMTDVDADDGGSGGSGTAYLADLHQDRLFGQIQSSRREIEGALRGLQAVLIDGHYRVVCPRYTSRFLHYLSSMAVENDWDLSDALNLQAVCQQFQVSCPEEFPPQAVAELCRIYSNDNGDGRLSMRKISRFFGIELLKSQKVRERT